MIATTLLLAASVVGVETGWQPHEDGGLEYIIQIEPELLSVLREGEALTSEIPAQVEGVRRYRIVVGKNPLPRIGAENPPPASSAVPSHPPVEMPAEETGSFSPPHSATEEASAPADEALIPVGEAMPDEQQPAEQQPAPRYEFPSFDPPPIEPQRESEPQVQPAVIETEPPLLNETEADALQTAFKQSPTALDTVALEGDEAAETAEATLPTPDGNPTWIGWTLALLTLAASLGANCYLGWMWLDTRRRYQSLVYQRTAA